MHGLLLAIERRFVDRLDGAKSPLLNAARAFVVFFAVSLLWILFKLPDFAHAAAYFVGLFSSDEVPNPPKIYRSLALAYALPVILQHFIVPGRPKARGRDGSSRFSTARLSP